VISPTRIASRGRRSFSRQTAPGVEAGGSIGVVRITAVGAELPMPRIAGQPLPVTRPSASRPERLGRPGLSRPPAGLHRWRTIADARCSVQWTGRGNRRSGRARRSPRKFECRRQCLRTRRRKFGGTRPAIGSRCHRVSRACPTRRREVSDRMVLRLGQRAAYLTSASADRP